MIATTGGSGLLRHELWRCTSCEALTRTGWRPPTWINATQREWIRLRDELADAVELAYTEQPLDQPRA